MIPSRTAAACVVATGLLVTPACSTGGGRVEDELLVFAEDNPAAPVLMPKAVNLESATLGTVASTDDGEVIALEVWIQLRGESIAQAQRYCLLDVDVAESPIPECPGVIFEGEGVRVHGDPTGSQMALRNAEWTRP